jgi:hypothetical protein
MLRVPAVSQPMESAMDAERSDPHEIALESLSRIHSMVCYALDELRGKIPPWNLIDLSEGNWIAEIIWPVRWVARAPQLISHRRPAPPCCHTFF